MIEDTRTYSVGDMTGDLDDFCDGVIDVLRYWVAVHLDAQTWANDWLCGYHNYAEAYDATKLVLLDNGVFKYTKDDWRRAAYRCETDMTFWHCSECHVTYDAQFTGYCQCEDPDEDTSCQLEGEDLVAYLDAIAFTPSPGALREAFLTDAFAVYLDAFGGSIEAAAEEMQRIISGYNNAETNLYRLQLAMQALECQHVHGMVVEDHGSLIGMDDNAMDAARTIRDEGLLTWEPFTEDDYLRDWLDEDGDPVATEHALGVWKREQPSNAQWRRVVQT